MSLFEVFVFLSLKDTVKTNKLAVLPSSYCETAFISEGDYVNEELPICVHENARGNGLRCNAERLL